MKILLINGPNLNMLGKRKQDIYGDKTLAEIESAVMKKAKQLGATFKAFQSNHEGELIDFLQAEAPRADGIIINPGALTHYGLSLRDALDDANLPIIEIHISDIHAREDWRSKSVIQELAKAQICGHGWQGYIEAVDMLIDILNSKKNK
jgi:3-dehydroquinate dehydratase II